MSQLNASRHAHTDCMSNSQVFLGGWLISALEKDEIILANTYWNSLKKKKFPQKPIWRISYSIISK